MSEENVDKIKAMLAPLGDADVAGIDWKAEAIRELLERDYSPDVELTTLESAVGIGPSRSYQGWDGLVQYFAEWFEPFSEYRLKWLGYIDAGQRVLVPMQAFAVGRGSGVQVEMELVLSYELQDGLITRLDEYDTLRTSPRSRRAWRVVMSENVEIVRRMFERWNRGERGFSDDEVDPAVKVVSRFQPEPFRGRDGLRGWMQEIDENFKEWRLVVEEWREVGDRVVGLGHIRIGGKESGVEFDQPAGWLLVLREGRLLELQTFLNGEEALEAAGLEA